MSKSKTTKEEESEICSLYKDKRSTWIAKQYGVSVVTIHNILRRNGVTPNPRGFYSKRYSLDESFFDEIDTEEKAYFLGLMGSDGNVAKDRPVFEIGLSGEDKILVERFKNAIKYTGPISPHKTYRQISWRMTVYSKKMTDDLIKHGIVPNKSIIYELNQEISNHLIRHYIRGMFDGDGSVRYRPDGQFEASLISSKPFIKKFMELIKNTLNLEPHVEEKKNTLNLKLGGSWTTFLFLDWMYKDSSIYLPRKYNVYCKCIETLTKRLKNIHEVYIAWQDPQKRKRIVQICERLGLDTHREYNGLCMSVRDQETIAKLYQSGITSKHLHVHYGVSDTLIRHLLNFREIKRRSTCSNKEILKSREMIKSAPLLLDSCGGRSKIPLPNSV
jgi:acylphosphatase